MTITDYSGAQASILAKMIEKIARATVQYLPMPCGALSKLSEVHVIGTSDEFREDFTMCALFTVLPSMRSISGTKVWGERFRWMFEAQNSTITDVSIKESVISASSFAELLKGIKGLRSFKYEAAFSYPYINTPQWKPREIVAILLGNAKHSLEELDLTYVDPGPDDLSMADTVLMGSLHLFNNLRHIRANVAMFAFKSLGSRNEQGIDVEQGFWMEDDTGKEGLRLLPLANVLPPSVEKLTLVGFFLEGEATLLFSGLSKVKGVRLPKFREVIVHEEVLVYKDMQTTCDELGIALRHLATTP